jgi:hypothetical protein
VKPADNEASAAQCPAAEASRKRKSADYSAEQLDAVDRADIKVFRASTPFQPARQLILSVRPQRSSE